MPSRDAISEPRSRPLDLAAIAIAGVLASGFLGTTTNAVNGLVSPRSFVTGRGKGPGSVLSFRLLTSFLPAFFLSFFSAPDPFFCCERQNVRMTLLTSRPSLYQNNPFAFPRPFAFPAQAFDLSRLEISPAHHCPQSLPIPAGFRGHFASCARVTELPRLDGYRTIGSYHECEHLEPRYGP